MCFCSTATSLGDASISMHWPGETEKLRKSVGKDWLLLVEVQTVPLECIPTASWLHEIGGFIQIL
jgi:hypothetical protein